MRGLAPLILTILAILVVAPPPAEASLLCKWFGRCLYESPGFRITVVDKETGQPLAEVHALAVWLNYGLHGTRGPLMALEAVSGPDGVLAFPGWGPLRGSQTGLVLARDPAISLFKAGYKTLLVYNTGPPEKTDTTRVRPFYEDGKTFALEPFQGTSKEWVKELDKAAYPPEIDAVSQHAPNEIRSVYLNRKRRVKAEAERLPPNRRDVEQLLDSLGRSIKFLFLEEGKKFLDEGDKQ